MGEMMDLFDPDHSDEISREILLKYLDRLIRHLKTRLVFWKMYMAIFSQPAVFQLLADELQAASKQPLDMMERYLKNRDTRNPNWRLHS